MRSIAALALVVLPTTSVAQNYGRDVTFGASYMWWTPAVSGNQAPLSRTITFHPRSAGAAALTAWLNPAIGLRGQLGYATTPVALRDAQTFTPSTSVRVTSNTRIMSGSGELLLRPIGDRARNLLLFRMTPYIALGGGVTRFDPGASGPCIISGEPDGCGVAFDVDTTTFLSQPRWRAMAVAALGMDVPLTRMFGLRLEAGDRWFMSPVVRLERSPDGSYSRPNDPTMTHGVYAQLALRAGVLGRRTVGGPRRFAGQAILDSAAGEVTLSDVTPRRPTGVLPVDAVAPRVAGNDGIYDVVLDVPNVSVEEIVLEVNNVQAHVSLEAKVAKLVQLSVGADVGIDRVYLGIRGVQAEAHLKVDLDNVATIVDRVLTTVDRNPEIITGLLQTLETTVQTVGGVANTALQPGGVVSQVVETVGDVANTALQPGGVVSQVVTTVGDVANTALQPGGVVDNAVSTLGGVANTALMPGGVVDNAISTVGGIANTALMPGGIASQLVDAVGGTLNNLTTQGGLLSPAGVNALGQTVARVVDGTGRILERTIDQAGTLVGDKVLGSVLQLPILQQTTLPTGQLVRLVRDVTGAVIEVTTDAAGSVLSTRVLQAATGMVGNQLQQVVPQVQQALPPLTRPDDDDDREIRRSGPHEPEIPWEELAFQQVPAQDVDRTQAQASDTVKVLLVALGVNDKGQVIQRVVEPSGQVVDRTIDPMTGRLMFRKAVGNVLRMPAAQQQSAPDGSLVRVVEDPSGAVLELTFTAQGVLTRMKALKLGSSVAVALPTVVGVVPGTQPSPLSPPSPTSAPSASSVPSVASTPSVPSVPPREQVAGNSAIAANALASAVRPAAGAVLTNPQNIVNEAAASAATKTPAMAQALTQEAAAPRPDPDRNLTSRRGAGVSPGSLTAAEEDAGPTLLLAQYSNGAGQFIQRTVDSEGRITERQLNAAGQLVVKRRAANARLLPMLREYGTPDGRFVRLVRDASGAVIELLFTRDGKLAQLRVLELGGAIVSSSVTTPSREEVVAAAAASRPAPSLLGPPVLALLSQGRNAAGQVVQRVIEPNGRIVVRVVDEAGKLVQRQEVADIMRLAVVNTIPQPNGRMVVITRDVTGALLEVVLGADRKIASVRAVASR